MSKSGPKISIITVCFNSEKTIRKTLESIKAQSYSNYEYIVVDGKSTDNTINIIKEYSEIITTFVSEQDSGIYDAFNKGVSLATGDLIAILNSDDWYEHDTLLSVANYYNEIRDNEGLMIICSEMKRWFDSDTYSHLPLLIESRNKKNIFKHLGVAHPATFVSKEVYDLIGNYDTNYRICADSDFLLRCFFKGVKFYPLYKSIVNMRDGGVSNNVRTFHKKLKERYNMRVPYISKTYNFYKFINEYFIGRMHLLIAKYIKKFNIGFIYKIRNRIRIPS
ncbi:glycosyltransferase family 2 protein [Priestia megaterium]|uniref:glycosyltransferase family 2 protein n=1 Tax=Priestia megaterium TaxID=1404 RepID=UPI0032D96A02